MKVIYTSSPEFVQDLRHLGATIQEHGGAVVAVINGRLVAYGDDPVGRTTLHRAMAQAGGGFHLGIFRGCRDLGRRVRDAIAELERRLS
jgi:class 3 adenylate cyclase